MAEHIFADSKSLGEAPFDLKPISTEHFGSLYCIYTYMRAVGRDGLKSLTIIVKSSLHESNLDQDRSMSLQFRAHHGLIHTPFSNDILKYTSFQNFQIYSGAESNHFYSFTVYSSTSRIK